MRPSHWSTFVSMCTVVSLLVDCGSADDGGLRASDGSSAGHTAGSGMDHGVVSAGAAPMGTPASNYGGAAQAEAASGGIGGAASGSPSGGTGGRSSSAGGNMPDGGAVGRGGSVWAGAGGGTPSSVGTGGGGQAGATNVNDPLAADPTCTSAAKWYFGNNALMRPGEACMACHARQRGPAFSVAGTLFPTGHEPNDCNGAGSSSGAVLVVTDAQGAEHRLTPNAAGNFYLQSAISMPYRAKGRDRARRAKHESAADVR